MFSVHDPMLVLVWVVCVAVFVSIQLSGSSLRLQSEGETNVVFVVSKQGLDLWEFLWIVGYLLMLLYVSVDTSITLKKTTSYFIKS